MISWKTINYISLHNQYNPDNPDFYISNNAKNIFY